NPSLERGEAGARIRPGRVLAFVVHEIERVEKRDVVARPAIAHDRLALRAAPVANALGLSAGLYLDVAEIVDLIRTDSLGDVHVAGGLRPPGHQGLARVIGSSRQTRETVFAGAVGGSRADV